MALKGPRDLSTDQLRAKIKEMEECNVRDRAGTIDMQAAIVKANKLIDMRRAVISECEAELRRRDEQ